MRPITPEEKQLIESTRSMTYSQAYQLAKKLGLLLLVGNFGQGYAVANDCPMGYRVMESFKDYQ